MTAAATAVHGLRVQAWIVVIENDVLAFVSDDVRNAAQVVTILETLKRESLSQWAAMDTLSFYFFSTTDKIFPAGSIGIRRR